MNPYINTIEAKQWDHDDVIKWKHFRVTGHLCGEFTGPRWIPHTKTSDAGALMFILICARINGWVNNREAGDLRRHRAHYDVIVMWWNSGHHVRLLHYFSIQLQDYGLYFSISISQWYYQNFPHAQGCSFPCTMYVFNVISVFNCRIMVYVFYLDFSMVLPKFPPCPMLLIPLYDVCLLRYFRIQLQDYGLCFLSW